MITITDKSLCCGCNACVQACPKQCISMREDSEGFLYPHVDTSLCVDCGKCDKVCPVLSQGTPSRPLKVYAAINPNEDIRRQSSSGGIFTLLAEQIINAGGVVFGARFDESWQVVHDYAETLEGLASFRGSKYVQSRIGDTYRHAEAFLKQGRQVLFTGTPCQIAGLRRFLRKEYDNLLAVDFVCHGVPSPLIWRKYLAETLEELRAKRGVGRNSVSLSMDGTPVITGISFRDKSNGWKKFGFKLSYAALEAVPNMVSSSAIVDEHVLLQPFPENLFMRGFLADIYLRPSCYACPAKAGKSGADITIADYWGIENVRPAIDDDKGVGLVLVNTAKGEQCFDKEKVNLVETSYEEACAGNPSIIHSSRPHTNRDYFFYHIKRGRSMNQSMQLMFSTRLIARICRVIYRKLTSK